MGADKLSIWYDPPGDFLEVIWEVKEGYYTETTDERVQVKVDMDGKPLGFHILGLRTVDDESPLQVDLFKTPNRVDFQAPKIDVVE